jgi:hypothetical protein
MMNSVAFLQSEDLKYLELILWLISTPDGTTKQLALDAIPSMWQRPIIACLIVWKLLSTSVGVERKLGLSMFFL